MNLREGIYFKAQLKVNLVLQDTNAATEACSGLQSAFFEQPSARQLTQDMGSVGELTTAVDIMFLWICGVLVFMMQAGFAMVRTAVRFHVVLSRTCWQQLP